jgi:hypothetical protein
VERCLELWENDGPTKAMKNYMSYTHFQVPDTWNSYRDIDEKINMDDVNRLLEEGEGAANVEVEESPAAAGNPPAETKKGK